MKSAASKIKYSEIIGATLKDEKILFCSEFDVDECGNFTEGLFAVTHSKIAVFNKERVLLVLLIEKIYKISCAEYIGGGALEAFTDGGRQIIVRFSMNMLENYSAATELISEIIEGAAPETIKIQNINKEKLCPKCGKPFIHNTNVCRHCADKLGIIKRLWQISKPCRPLYAVLLIYFWISSSIAILTPILNKHLVNDVLTAAKTSYKKLAIIVLLMLLCSVITTIIQALRDVTSSKASNLLVKDLRNEIYEKIQRMPLGYIEEKKTGDLVQRINNDTQRIQSFIQDIAILAVNEVFLFVAIAIVTFSMDFVMSLLIFVPMPVAFYLVRMIRKSIQRRYRKQWRKMDILTNRLSDVLNGIKVVKVFGREDDEIKKFKQTAENVRALTTKNEKYVYTIFPIIKFIMGFGSYFVLLYGGSRVLGGEMTLGDLVLFSTYGSQLYSKIEWFSMLPRHFTMAVASSQRVFEILDEDEEKYNEGANIEDISGEFNIDNVSFGYKSYRRVLKNIDESIKKGEMIGLVGHSGAGKSTLINLIMRLYRPNKGEIRLDGMSLSDISSEKYKKSLGVVLQESYLFSGSVIDNIRYAAPDATLEECIIAAKKANAHDFIMELPDGYDTNVGEKGCKLSGGQRQRISIARAIVGNPKILILDEATASVDTETEIKIQQALTNVTKGKTVFAIAHRLSTLKNADRLFVLDEGSVAEKGTHEELMEKNGIYARLIRAQQTMAKNSVTIDGQIENKNEKERKEYE